ncbi:MAG: hypothetical protein ABJH63_12580 [Rhizobiaceae bacterium]
MDQIKKDILQAIPTSTKPLTDEAIFRLAEAWGHQIEWFDLKDVVREMYREGLLIPDPKNLLLSAINPESPWAQECLYPQASTNKYQ